MIRDTPISDSTFAALWGEALAASDRDAYVSDWAHSSIWEDDPESEIPSERIEYLGKIWDIAHMSANEIVGAAGLNRTEFAQRFCLPYRTLTNWCRGERSCPDYIRLMMAEALGLLVR